MDVVLNIDDESLDIPSGITIDYDNGYVQRGMESLMDHLRSQEKSLAAYDFFQAVDDESVGFRRKKMIFMNLHDTLWQCVALFLWQSPFSAMIHLFEV